MEQTTAARLGALLPDAADRLREAEAAAWRVTDPAQLELCRRRIAQMLGAGDSVRAEHAVRDESAASRLVSWWTSTEFTSAEQAHLAFAEQFATSVSSMTEADLAPLLELGTAHEVYDFVSALCVVDQVQRLEMVTRVVL